MRVKGGGTAGVLNRRAREGGERERGPITQHRRSDYTRPWITQGHGPSTQRTRVDNDTGRNKQRICTYECKQIAEQGITTHDGARIRCERTGRRTDADTCSLGRTKGSRSEMLQDALGAFYETARASSKPAQGKLRSRKESKNRERSSEIGSAALRPPYAR